MAKKGINREPHRRRLLGPTGTCKCYHCGDLLDKNTITLDHLIPQIRGGTNNPENIVASCYPCNNAKGMGNKVCPKKRAEAADKIPVVRLSREIKQLKTIIRGLRVYSSLHKKCLKN